MADYMAEHENLETPCLLPIFPEQFIRAVENAQVGDNAVFLDICIAPVPIHRRVLKIRRGHGITAELAGAVFELSPQTVQVFHIQNKSLQVRHPGAEPIRPSRCLEAPCCVVVT